VDKLQILGSDFLPTLTRFIDLDTIPKYLGGNLVDAVGDTECRALIGPGGIVPPTYLVGVASDGHGACCPPHHRGTASRDGAIASHVRPRLRAPCLAGLGEEINVAAGKHADMTLRVPAGATVSWAWGMQDKDANFSVVARAADAAAALPAGAVDVSRSIMGVHLLSSATRAPATAVVHVESGGDVKAPLPGVAGSAEVEVLKAAHMSKHRGSWTAPGGVAGAAAAAAAGGAGAGGAAAASAASPSYLVRLRWDNGYSWFSSKTVVRRVDVLLPGHTLDSADVLREADPAEAFAASRMRHLDTFCV